MKVILKFLNLAVFPITLVSVLLLFISGFSPSVSPEYISGIALLGLAFPYIWLLNLFLFFYWLVQLRLKTLFPLAALLINFSGIQLYWQWNSDSIKPKNEETLNVVSYNANLFGYYQGEWMVDSVCRMIKNEDPELVLIQEIYNKKGSLERMRDYLKKNIGLPYGCITKLSNNREYGMCILSKYPIKNWDKIYLGGATGNMSMYADISMNKASFQRTVRIYNIHLQSVRFDKKDYENMEMIMDKPSGNVTTEGIIAKLKTAYKKRAPQVNSLRKELEKCQFTKIVGGDFNDVPMSYTYHQLSENLNDAFCDRGNGLETTYKGLFPSFRIDYLLSSNSLETLAYKSIKNTPSDHKMIVSNLNYSPLFE